MIIDPITVTPETTLYQLLEIINQYHYSGFPVVNGKI